jgi:hypothetical protein
MGNACSGGNSAARANPGELEKILNQVSPIDNIKTQIGEMKQDSDYVVIRAQRTAFKEGMFNVKKRNPQAAAKGAP